MTIATEVSNLRQVILDLEQKLEDAYSSEEKNIEEMCDVLVTLNLVKRDLGSVYDSFSRKVGIAMGELNMHNASDGATIEKKMSYDRRGWQHKDLGRAVAQKISEMSVDMDTGERVLTAEEMVVKLLDYVQPSYWRTTELSKVGINADNYCEIGDLKTSIIVRKGNTE
jgi:hypothetical protein